MQNGTAKTFKRGHMPTGALCPNPAFLDLLSFRFSFWYSQALLNLPGKKRQE